MRGVTVEPPSDAQSADPGETVTYTLRITNTGNCADTFDLAVSGDAWNTIAPSSVGPLAPGAGTDVEVTVDVPQARGDMEPAKFTVSGPDKQAVGELAARLRKSRPPEPYKGKGVRYVGEYVRRKVGKAFAGTGGV